ncbi:protein ENHANCED DOWNY MILDEW 2-like [Phragmites australis]|uniref:protein ENHANCED DOWNY MILDEW 2-like n=1 Tax=Phragmites australis TaxID=29695 RepID=UPI002D78607D|nr:protein ENHANCED DOWNY MILDEW 2-like [Phragmites australis]
MASMITAADELQRRNRAREIKQKSNKRNPGTDDDANKGDDACAICDNGGFVTCCDGGCQRSFHLDEQESEDSKCRLALGVTKEQAKMINEKKEKFICKNCKYKQHQCFVCGLLGSSDLSSKAKVFQCEYDDCRHFYHPKCVAGLLYPDSEEATLFEQQVAAGLGFSCPMHECIVCKGGENKDDMNMQFAVCRRCPTTYHRKCLPSDIIFKTRKRPNGSMQRAWDDILPDRILIYCTKHEIIRKLGTPKRNHIIFPDVKKLRVPKTLEGASMEQDILEEEELLNHPPFEQSQSPSPAATDQNQCSCSTPIDSFAPSSLFMHPHLGSCGWLGD